MRYIPIFLLAGSVLLASPSGAVAANCTWEKVMVKEPIWLQNKGFFQFWIAKLIAVCRGTDGKLDGYSPVVIEITHVSDKSPFKCGQRVHLKFGDMDDAYGEAAAVRDCE